ncbi:DUF1697 domain-containing protein [Novosphingobium colocasiae]|uniref:DUF1697 domain-containing protein n=2 Tax=Bacteria TaxID=2 RepID=A0A918PMJ2_9SPHN|nr:DUF1697 domain-containing protein [Novosphingobium colocasiae]GGZ16220.1 hypothetical protein GCM10011614_33740 [Novosphingobium colocasiae]
MTRYCAFFGSINVGGNRLSMADLRYAFEREEFANVETVVASGNVLFDYDDRPTEGLEELFAHMMADRFDIESFVAVRTKDEVRTAIDENPFADKGEDKRVHTHFLEGQPTKAQFEKLVADHEERGDEEKMALGRRCLFVDYVDGVARTRLTGDYITRRLKHRHTARNINSLRRILDKM